MTYDFTTIMERHGKDAMAVDALGLPGFPGAPKEGFDAIPMWVADMKFPNGADDHGGDRRAALRIRRFGLFSAERCVL